MKHTRSLINGLVACAIALALVSTATAATADAAGQGKQGRAKVIRKKGEARYTTGNNVWQPLKVGDIIKPGTIIQTSKNPGDFVDLALGEGSGSFASSTTAEAAPPVTAISYQPKTQQDFVRVWENSLLGIDKLTSLDTGADVVTDTQLDLKAGHIFGSVKKMSAASRYEVKIPNGVAGIRGTIYDITADGVVKVAVGSVVVAYVGPDGTVITQVVGAGQQFDARTGQVSEMAPGEKQRLLHAGGQAHGGNLMGPTTFTFDHTIYHVSPIHGRGHHRGRGQGGGGVGDGEGGGD